MKDKSRIEAALHRALENQIEAPTLDRRFDAAVWARIEAEEARSKVAKPPARAGIARAARWLQILNVVGLASVGIFISFFATEMLAGMNFTISLPEISSAQGERVMSLVIAAVAVLVALMFTPWGRRVREEWG